MRRLFSLIFFILFGLAFTGVSILMLVSNANDKKVQTGSTTAIVSSYDAVEEERTDSDGFTRIEIVNYPVLEYTVDGETYKTRYKVGTGDFPYEIGQEVGIVYDPDNVGSVTIEGDNSSSTVGYIFLAVGIFTFIFGVSSVLKSRR